MNFTGLLSLMHDGCTQHNVINIYTCIQTKPEPSYWINIDILQFTSWQFSAWYSTIDFLPRNRNIYTWSNFSTIEDNHSFQV